MLKMRVVHAHEGDSFILLYGPLDKPRALLCDGGPRDTYGPHLKKTLEDLGVSSLDAVVLSHVDNDHVIGLLDFFADLRDQKAAGGAPFMEISELWINAFDKTIDRGGALEPRVRGVVQQMAAQNLAMNLASAALQGVREGHKLNVTAQQLGIAVNSIRNGEPFIADNEGLFAFHGLEIQVVGPTRENLDALADKWKEWLDQQEERIGNGRLRLAAMADKSIPNLSSIQLLVKAQGKTMLLTGDGRGDHLLQALEEAGLLDQDGAIEVDVLKVPHHGSDRNVTRDFFERVRAKTYVISANGKYGNPDLPTLQWIVESHPAADAPITLVLTNRTPTVDKLEKAFPPAENGYTLAIRDAASDFIDVDLA